MKNMDRRFDVHDVRRMDNMHNSSSILPRQAEFRPRTSSESFTQGWVTLDPATHMPQGQVALSVCVCVCVCVTSLTLL